jgi:hypothetical protein
LSVGLSYLYAVAAGRLFVVEDEKFFARVSLGAIGHLDAAWRMGHQERGLKEVEHHLDVADGVDMAVDVEVAIEGLQAAFGL